MNLSQSYELAISIATDGDYLDGFTSRQVETIHDMLKVINLELFWKKEDELKQQQQEIESLKTQLAQYQSDDCVLVPKKPNSKLLKALRVGFYWDENTDSAAYSPILGYKNMIEAQEQDSE